MPYFIGQALAYQPSETPPQLPRVSLALNEVTTNVMIGRYSMTKPRLQRVARYGVNAGCRRLQLLYQGELTDLPSSL